MNKKQRLKFITAGMLENNICVVYDDENKKIINNIVLNRFSDIGSMGRMFYYDKNKLLLKVIDRAW